MALFVRTLYFFLILSTQVYANLQIGVGKIDITPPIGTPSAGYADRKGASMEGMHDPLLAIALFIDNGEKQIVLCSVDHLGFTYEMVQEVIQRAHLIPRLETCEIYIGSSHTHSGGGAFLNIPFVGEFLAGTYDPDVTHLYIQRTVEAITIASQKAIPAQIGIGYGKTENLSYYRSPCPIGLSPSSDVAVIKVTKLDGSPLAVLFNYAVHPTVLRSSNRLFSADFVGYARDQIQSLLGENVQALYFNGAQGDINPVIFNEHDRFASCQTLGHSLAETVVSMWGHIATKETLDIHTQKETYSFKPQSTPQGLKLSLERYQSEINLIVLNKKQAFVTIPGELSTFYDQKLKAVANEYGYDQISILGLTNDAHGYILSPESWRHPTFESSLSFGGEHYGSEIYNQAINLLKGLRKL